MNQLSMRNKKTGWSSKLQEKLPNILEEFKEYTQFNKGKPKDVNM